MSRDKPETTENPADRYRQCVVTTEPRSHPGGGLFGSVNEVNNPEGVHRKDAPEGVVEDCVRTKHGGFSSIRMNGFGDWRKAIHDEDSRENIPSNSGDRQGAESATTSIRRPWKMSLNDMRVAAGLLQPLGGSAPEVAHTRNGRHISHHRRDGFLPYPGRRIREAIAEVGICQRNAVNNLGSSPWPVCEFQKSENVKRVKDI